MRVDVQQVKRFVRTSVKGKGKEFLSCQKPQGALL